ncbi:hypothetical protein N24_1822 [Corynebacterium suranareeae]|uniref:Lipoprotein n=1 Tax=Corynebacterium suranareeae TaxID=2506452 RepID=A0A160PR45_9CORY|nr:hypothetical protein [Corynebacterium suranareeae]BAU96084.1 hypothetical protein N24_1822 [Corynebacterium suranareeae]
MKTKSLNVAAIISALLLTGCSNHSSPLYDYLNTSTSTTVEQVRLSDLYDEQWTEFALVCPYTAKEEIKNELGISIRTYLTNSTDDSSNDIVLRAEDGSYEWIYFNRFDTMSLCPGKPPELKYRSIDSILEFEYDHDYGNWDLTGITEPTVQ